MLSLEKELQKLSIICCYNIYMCIRINQTNDVNDFHIMLNCTYMHSIHAEGIVEIYFMPDVSEIPETYMFPQN